MLCSCSALIGVYCNCSVSFLPPVTVARTVVTGEHDHDLEGI